MSESSDEDFPPAAARASNSTECLDLTLVDTDDEDTSPTPQAQGGCFRPKRKLASKKRPAPNVVTPSATKKKPPSSRGQNSDNTSRKRATSMPETLPIVNGFSREEDLLLYEGFKEFGPQWKKISDSLFGGARTNEELRVRRRANEYKERTGDEGLLPQPGRQGKGAPKVSVQHHSSSKASAGGDGVPAVGAVGYTFHKNWTIKREQTVEQLMIHGEVVEILGSSVAVDGKDRRCVYADGDVKDHSVDEISPQGGLTPVKRCKSKNCPWRKATQEAIALAELEGSTTASDSLHEVSGSSSPSQSSSNDNEGTTDAAMKGGKDQAGTDEDSEGSDLFSSDDESEEDNAMNNQQVARDGETADDSDGSDLFPSDDDDSEAGVEPQNAELEDGSCFLGAGLDRVGRNDVNTSTAPVIELEPVLKLKKEKASSLVTDFVTPPVVRREPELYYFAVQWGHRIQVEALPLGDGPPQSKLNHLGSEYEILFSELVARKGTGKRDDRMGQKYYKSYYVATSGLGLDALDLKSALQSIADFEQLTYEKGAHKALSRLKLLVSPSCRPPDGDRLFLMHRLPDTRFEIIEDNGHLGCGFIPKRLLVKLLGKSAGAQRAFAIQVRLVGPSRIGIAKGMLFVKAGIAQIQVPTSMLKVNKSSSSTPLHTNVVLNVTHVYPSTNQYAIGRLFNDGLKDPPLSMLRDLKPPCGDLLRVLACKGVPDAIVAQYLSEFRDMKTTVETRSTGQRGASKRARKARDQECISELKERDAIKHANFVGVSDPTGAIPSGHVFLTGMGYLAPSRVLITRNPCTTGKDGIVVPVASWRDMPEESFVSLSRIGFGAVVFPLGDELAAAINDGDLDGDNYVCIWDERIIESAHNVSPDMHADRVFADDDLVESSFLYEIDGVLEDSVVVQKTGEEPDTYSVETGPKDDKRIIQMTRQEIREITDYITKVVGDDAKSRKSERRSRGKGKKSRITFKSLYASGKCKWLSTKEIRKEHIGSPEALVDYVQQENLLKSGLLSDSFVKWIKRNSPGAPDMTEIANHRTKDGKVEVLCKYNDDDELWLPIEDVKKDCKFFLGAYAKSRPSALRRPEWKGVDCFWLDEVQDLMCGMQRRSNDIHDLMITLYRNLKRATQDLGCNHPDTESWGDAYKLSLEIEKHGGKPRLPFRLHRQLPKKTLQKLVGKDRE